MYRNDTDPDFKGAGFVEADAEVKIPNMAGDRGPSSNDYTAAKQALRNNGVSETRITELFNGTEYRVHHVEDQATIQFIKKDIHTRFTHRSAVSDIANGRPPRTY